MGGYWSSSSSSNFTSCQDVLKELEGKRIERELAIAQLMERRKQAYQLAESREKFWWTLSGGAVTSALTVLSSFHHKNLLHLLPVFPIATYIGYSAHYSYGNKMETINNSAARLVDDELDSLTPSPITVEDVRKRIDDVILLRHDDEDL